MDLEQTANGYFIENPSIYTHSEFTDKPEISFFKEKHYRHIPFSMQNIDVMINCDLAYGNSVECIIPRHGDLMHKMYISIELPALPEGYYWKNSIGHSLIDYIDIYIDSQKIDRQTGEWMNIHHKLFTDSQKRPGINELIQEYNTKIQLRNESHRPKEIIIPLYFWFCNSIDKAFPLVALKNANFRMILKLNDFSSLYLGGPPNLDASEYKLSNPKFMIDYIFIDDSERMKFVSNDVEYNIEQIQYQTLTHNLFYTKGVSKDEGKHEFDLECTGPVKFVAWTLRQNIETDYKYITNNMDQCYFSINGTELIKRNKKKNKGIYGVMSYYGHNNVMPSENIYSFPMCLYMDSSIPNGATNMSNVNEMRFDIKLNPLKNTPQSTLNMYFVKYNVLKFSSGVANVLFS